MQTWANPLFYIVFLGQIFLISWYYPRKILRRITFVLNTYPPSEYPKLYPKPVEYYKIGRSFFRFANRAIVVLGFIILYAVINIVDHSSFADDGFISEFWPAVYGLIQFAPWIVLEMTENRNFKLMRKAIRGGKRKAELRPRNLRSFASPIIVGMAIAMLVAAILFDAYLHEFDFALGSDSFGRMVTLLGTNLLLAAVGLWMIHGRKPDPHQSFEDRAHQITTGLHSLLYVSVAMSLFFMVQAADDVFGLGYLDATMLSLYMQLVAYLSIGHMCRNMKLDDIDFDVYKNGVAPA